MQKKTLIKDYWTTPKVCLTCGNPGVYSILLAGSKERWYLPNQYACDQESMPLTEIWFCHLCMRKLEDKFRSALEELSSLQS